MMHLSMGIFYLSLELFSYKIQILFIKSRILNYDAFGKFKDKVE